jgi:general secretion pathway protein A
MYNQFFRLREAPFQMRADPRFLFLTPQHREALAGITHAILTNKGLLALTGDIGTGKTTLLNAALQYLPPARARCCGIMNPVVTPAELLGSVLFGFGEPMIGGDKAERLARLQGVLMECELSGKTPVLLIDEAHLLSPELLDEIRLLGNFPELQLILSGQPELDKMLQSERFKPLRQRIAWRVVLEPLSAEQVAGYIRFRWQRAGGTEAPPFPAEAVAAVVKCSEGFPRVVNSICDNALMLAFRDKSEAVTGEHVFAAAGALQIGREPRASAAEG